MRAKLISEAAFEDKDKKRIEDLFSKADGDDNKILRLAQNMANSIDDYDKAVRRAEAAYSILGKENNLITDIFLNRAKQIEEESNENLIFYLMDENNKEYWFKIAFSNLDEFDEFENSEDFENFMYKMETSGKSWSGVHDGTGDENSVGYSSTEIEDFPTAIQMWFNFFKSKNLLSPNSKINIS